MALFRNLLITINWLIVLLAEILLLTAGLISPGHDKGRLIPIALFVILVPAVGYGVHLFIKWLFSSQESDNTNG